MQIKNYFLDITLSLVLVVFPIPIFADVSTITVTAPTPTPSSYTDPNLFQSSILNSTNTFRYQHGALAVVWNSSLADFAQSYSANCQFRHSGTPGLGENLAIGYADVTSAVDAWGDERSLYSWSNPGFSEETGHFTQLVWKGTTATGCGVTNCTGQNGQTGFLLVCEYWPPGNVINSGSDPNTFFEQDVGEQDTSNQMPSGWEQTATATATSTGGGGGITLTPVATGPSATVTVSVISGSSAAYSQLGNFWTLNSIMSGMVVTIAAVITACAIL